MGRSIGRIRKRADYLRVQSLGRRVSTPHFVLVLYARPSGPAVGPGPRLGITTSRRVGGAVVRNRLKRVIREGFRRTLELWEDDVDLVVIARSPPPDNISLSATIDEWVKVGPRIGEITIKSRADRQKRQSTLADPR